MGSPSSPEPRVALVTGAARGIGRATVAALAAAGWRVLAVDRAADDPDLPYAMGTRAELEKVAARPDVAIAEADVRDVAALARAVAAAEDRWGHLDAALAVAGVIAGGVPAWEVPPGQEQAVIDIDAQQPFGRLLDPGEVAAVLAFLAGDGASGMTGAVIPVDGGLAL